ncbi:hypothetical protein [Lentzea sp. NPDC055074]
MKAVLPEVLPQGFHAVHNGEVEQTMPGSRTSNGWGYLLRLNGAESLTTLPLVESCFDLRVVGMAGEQALYVDEVRADGLLVRAATPRTANLPRHTMPISAFDRIGLVRFDELEELQPGTVPFLEATPSPHEKPRTSADEIADRITALLSEHAPGGWAEIRVECDALAGWQLLTTSAVTEAGDEVHWLPPVEVSQWFHRLRSAGFHAPGGAWYRANFVLARGESPTLRVDWAVEPCWKSFFPVPRRGGPRYRHIRDELAYFPRSLSQTPDWLVLAAAQDHDMWGPFHPEDRDPEPVSLVRTFDGITADGTPKLFRPAMSGSEFTAVLAYLDNAPVVLASRELVPDLLDPARPRQVPMAYQTDGRWVWSSSVAYYLRTHRVCPDVAFLAHVRLHRYELPARVPSALRARALSSATDQIALIDTSWNLLELMEPGLADEFEQASKAVLAVAEHLNLDPASYSLRDSVDGALCLVREGDRYAVFWLHDEDRRFYAEFDSPGDAATYLIGFFYSYAGSLQRT